MSDWKATGRTFRYWQAGEKPLWNNLYRLLGSCVTHADYIFQFWFDVVKDNMKQPLKNTFKLWNAAYIRLEQYSAGIGVANMYYILKQSLF